MDDVPRRISATTAWMLGLHCFMFLLVCDFISFCVSKENSIAQETIDRPLQRVSREKEDDVCAGTDNICDSAKILYQPNSHHRKNQIDRDFSPRLQIEMKLPVVIRG